MKTLRVIDAVGNKQDYETEFVPRIGERIVLEYGESKDTVRPRYFRVKDVEYHLQKSGDTQIRILTEVDSNTEHWPS